MEDMEHPYRRIIGSEADTHAIRSEKLRLARDHVALGLHYKGYIGDLDWVDAEMQTPQFSDSVVRFSAILLMVRKYLARAGLKDRRTADIEKAYRYLGYLLAMELEAKPIKMADVDAILAGHGIANVQKTGI
jgi:hypothetical protein